MKKFIWDLDETLLSGDFSYENIYFKEKLQGQDIECFLQNKHDYLIEYERTFFKYDVKLLSDFLSLKSGIVIDETVIRGWNEHNKTIPDTIHS